MKKIYYFFLLMTASTVGCIDSEPKDKEILPNLRTLTDEEQSLASYSGDFAIDLYLQLRNHDDTNLFFSPYSIQQALSMTMNGNKGTVLEEYLQALRYDNLTIDQANMANKGLTQFLQEVDPKVTFNVANGIWYKENLTVKEAFQEIVQQHYFAALSGLNMANPNSVDIINNWIEDHTNNLIQNMLDKIHDDAVMYLVNAIYFKGDWKYQFEKSATEQAPFHVDEQTTVNVDMMRTQEPADFRYLKSDHLTYLEIPYSTGQYSMGILLPDDLNLDKVEEQLNAENLLRWRTAARERALFLQMPKFKLRKKIDNLKEDLQALGLVTPFKFDPRNFTELFDTPTDYLKINRVIHDALIEVDEKGTEAAAATVVEIIEVTAGPSTPLNIKLNRPFLFFIQEKHSGTILFIGKLGDPSLL
ncbi:serpin family protein [Echinicola soli]|uniref:Serpin family protein n=1 Tax=Echinicola soli TaxID=2591634 RepID=A0A514CI51_9BACT|nr:serpin family protein [Echinicola soli]QDH79492.1 serpin family protein [Echinicola soli]